MFLEKNLETLDSRNLDNQASRTFQIRLVEPSKYTITRMKTETIDMSKYLRTILNFAYQNKMHNIFNLINNFLIFFH